MQEVKVTITDMIGRVWVQVTGYRPGSTIAISDLPAGSYQLIAGCKGYRNVVKRFMKL